MNDPFGGFGFGGGFGNFGGFGNHDDFFNGFGGQMNGMG